MKALYNTQPIFSSTLLARLLPGCIALFLSLTVSAEAQNILSRISSTERSDHKGFVVRYHLSQKADSFQVYQPAVDLIQMVVYGVEMDSAGIAVPEPDAAIDEIGFYPLPMGLGVDIYVPENTWFKAEAYLDGNSNDLLLGLTYTTRTELEYQTNELESIIWSRLAGEGGRYLANDLDILPAATVDNSYMIARKKMRFDVVVIDAGHGGHDPGAIGHNGTYEKDITLSIAKKIGGYINEYLPDVKVVYTREDDRFIELEERGSIANRAEGDLFISIHCNSHASQHAHGADVFFLGDERSKSALEVMKRENSVIALEEGPKKTELTEEDLLIYDLANSGYIATSERIAGLVEYQLNERARRRSRGVKQARFVVLYHASMPAILVETGFISNPREEQYLTSDYGQSIIASAIYRAVRDYKENYDKSQDYQETSTYQVISGQ